MKKALVLFVLPVLALAGTVTKTVTFDAHDLRLTQANGFDVVTLADYTSTGELGLPMLPVAVFNVVVPATATVTDVSVEPLDPVELAGTYRVHPAQPPVPIGSAPTRLVPPSPAAYAGSTPYPSKASAWDGYTGSKAEYRICGFCLYPVSYVPATGRLTLYQRMAVTVTYREADVAPHALSPRQVEGMAADVRGIVLNPEDVAGFAPPTRETDGMDCDYAVITASSFVSNWQTLADWRTRKGWYTRVTSVDTINARYTGRDLQEKIRNFIIDYYYNHGLRYVLLAGDNAAIPGRRCRVVVSGSTGNIPADAYYGDLQWSWDGDHDNIFGEMTGDTVDLYYDVLVGRASVDNAAHVSTFINKTLLYEKNPTTDYLRKMLLPYVLLFPEQSYSGQVVSESIATHTPAGWTDTYIAEPGSTTPIRDAINQGYNFVHGAAHGDDYGWYSYYGTTIYSTSTASGQTNSTRPCIVNSIACIAGNFEASDCLAEALMNNANGGAVATMMNSREGWGTPPAMGPSEKMDLQFYKYHLDEDSAEIGSAHAHSKDYYAFSARSQDVWRWCYYDLNLFGDPDMTMWKNTPATLTVTNADTVNTGTQSYQVTVSTGGNPRWGALVCCYKPGELHEIGRADQNGIASIVINPTTAGTMYLTVTAHGCLPVERTVVVRAGAPQPYIALAGYLIDDGGNHQLDPGESTNLLATLRNLGNLAATNVTGTLRTSSGYITLTDSTSSYGTLNPGDSAPGDPYHVSVSAGTPPGTPIQFTVHVTSNEGTWDPTFTTTVGTPPIPGAVTLDHDTGYCKLTVTALGSIGFTEPPARDPGSGFCYPKAGASQLYYSSFCLGNSAAYLVDRHYGNPPTGGPNTDFAIVDSLRPVTPGWSDEHYRCEMSDGGHTTPKGLHVTMNSHQEAAAGYDDFVVLQYDIRNPGGTAVNGLYAGIITDFDIGTATDNTVTSNETKRFTYMRQSGTANPSVGLKILYPYSFANLTAVDHDLYVYPDSAMTDNMKYRVLNGGISMRNSSRAYDWSAAVSVGPFDLAPGASYHCAFAMLGGTSAANFEADADSAQSWYDHVLAVRENEGVSGARARVDLVCSPNPFGRNVSISFQVPAAGRVRVQVFDVTGRTVATLIDQDLAPSQVRADWTPGRLANGIYLLKVSQPDGTSTSKLMLLR